MAEPMTGEQLVEHLDELVDRDPLALYEQALALVDRAERAEGRAFRLWRSWQNARNRARGYREGLRLSQEQRAIAERALAERKRLSTSPTRDDLTGLETMTALLHAADETDSAVKDLAWRTFALIRAYREQGEYREANTQLQQLVAMRAEERDRAREELDDALVNLKTAEGQRDDYRTAHKAAVANAQALRRALEGGVWDDGAAPGGSVCSEPVAPNEPGIDRPYGRICGMPVESEDCALHTSMEADL